MTMRDRKSIFGKFIFRGKRIARRHGDSPSSRPASLKHALGRLARWWDIYCLSLSWSRFFGGCGSVVALLSLSAMSFWMISRFVFQSVQVLGPSMSPTLSNAGYYWFDRSAYAMRGPRPGDIVAIKDPGGMGFDVKRVIATPYQNVYITHGKVYINGSLLREPYLMSGTQTYANEDSADELFCLGPDQFFVMGDNRGDSCDSRTFGPVLRKDILGKIVR